MSLRPKNHAADMIHFLMMDTFNPTSYSTIDLHMDFSIKLLVLAGVQGLEPQSSLLGSAMLPLHHTPIYGRGRGIWTLGTINLFGNLANYCTQPLCDPSIKWSLQCGLNAWPHPYQGCALPTELYKHWSRRRGSNPRHLPWQGNIPPIELLLQKWWRR